MSWLNDNRAFAARHEKSYAAAKAVYNVLAKRGPLSGSEMAGGESEFLAQWEWLAHRRDRLESIWQEPRFYYWTRAAFNLVGVVLGTSPLAPSTERYLEARGLREPAEGLEAHLGDFGAFALGAAWQLGESLTLRAPLKVALPWCLPASPWSVDGKGELLLLGVNDQGALQVQTGELRLSLPLEGNRLQTLGPLQLCQGPELKQAGGTLTLQPHAFNLPGMSVISSVVGYGTEYQWKNAHHCEAALAAIKRYVPVVYDDFCSGMRLLGLKPEEEGTVYNTSCSRLTGASIVTTYAEPLVLAEDLIHEFHHNRLFAVEDHEPFFDNAIQDAVGEEKFYSPWREDPRPLYGLFHAMHVFTAVGQFWLSVYRAGESTSQLLEYAACRLARLRVQLAITEQQLRTFAAFTPFGQEIFDEMSSDYAALREGANAIDISIRSPDQVPEVDGSFTPYLDEQTNEPLTVGQSLRQHVENFDCHDRCAELGILDGGSGDFHALCAGLRPRTRLDPQVS